MSTYGRTDDGRTPVSSLYPPNLSVGDKQPFEYYLFVKFDTCCREYCTYIVSLGGDGLFSSKTMFRSSISNYVYLVACTFMLFS